MNKIIRIFTWFTTLLIITLVVAFFVHRYPLYSKADYLQDAYFGLYTYGHKDEDVYQVFHDQILKQNSALQDYFIARWMVQNKVCNDLELLKTNYLYYKNIDSDSLYSNSTKDYWISYYELLYGAIQELEATCESKN